jgi:choline dehydrogenase-like flavoprotein
MSSTQASASAGQFDYIIVGGGSAGCVVASRLSERAECRVLLLEPGPPADDFCIRTPAGMAMMFKSERYNWRFHTEPVPTLQNRRLYWPRGKALGGSGAINGMVHNRGSSRWLAKLLRHERVECVGERSAAGVPGSGVSPSRAASSGGCGP